MIVINLEIFLDRYGGLQDDCAFLNAAVLISERLDLIA